MVKKKKPILARDVKVVGRTPEESAQSKAQNLIDRTIIEKAKKEGKSGGDVLQQRRESAAIVKQGIQKEAVLKELQIQQHAELENVNALLQPQEPTSIEPQTQPQGVLETVGQMGKEGTPLNVQTPLSTPGALSLLPDKAAGVVTLAMTAVGVGILGWASGGAAITTTTTATPKAAAATNALGGLSGWAKGIFGAIGLGSLSTLANYLTEGRYNEIKGDMDVLRTSSRDIVTDVSKGADPNDAIDALLLIESELNKGATALKLANQRTLKGKLSGRTPEEDIYRNLNAVIRRRHAVERYILDGDVDALIRSVGTEETA